jgi:hypothetical protein
MFAGAAPEYQIDPYASAVLVLFTRTTVSASPAYGPPA